MPLCGVMPIESIKDIIFASDVDGLVRNVLAFGRRYVVVDGFTGAGKSTLAVDLAARLRIPWIELDDFLPEDPTFVETQSYVARLDRVALRDSLKAAPTAVIDGILMRDALDGI